MIYRFPLNAMIIMHLEALKIHLLLSHVPAVWKIYSYDVNRTVLLPGENSFPCLFADRQVTHDHLVVTIFLI